jgi:rhodanese-related sulfurtransferase
MSALSRGGFADRKVADLLDEHTHERADCLRQARIRRMTDTPADLLNEARKTVPEMTAEEAKAKEDRGEVDLIVDVREPNEWDAGHIPGALFAPRGMLEWYADQGYANHKPQLAEARDKQVVIHCASGGRSLLAAQTLRRLGFKNVSSTCTGRWAPPGPLGRARTSGGIFLPCRPSTSPGQTQAWWAVRWR